MLKALNMLIATTVFAICTASLASADDKMKVVTTFTVLADMAAHVEGDAAVVVSITKPGTETRH